MSREVAIKISELSKKYRLHHPVRNEDGSVSNELWALKNINLEIKQGEHIGIVGPNGSGKSTLLRILAGVTKPSTGIVELSGKVAGILDIGAGFHPELTGRENIFLSGRLLGFPRKYIAARFDEIVDFSGIEKFIDEPVKNYSAGMYLRLAFSVIMQIEADIYLFDEALSVGDEEFRQKSYRRIREKITSGATTITVSHEIALLASTVTKMLHFPTLTPFDLPSTFEFVELSGHGIANDLSINDIRFSRELDRNIIQVELYGAKMTQNLDVVFLFHPINRIGESFAISSLHPININTHNGENNGIATFKASIPANTINRGNYKVTLQIVYGKTNVIKTFKDCLEFTIESSANAPDRFFDFYPGSIRLQTAWDIQY